MHRTIDSAAQNCGHAMNDTGPYGFLTTKNFLSLHTSYCDLRQGFIEVGLITSQLRPL